MKNDGCISKETYPVNSKAEAQLRDRLKHQFPPIDMDRPACNTHDCGKIPDRDESEW